MRPLVAAAAFVLAGSCKPPQNALVITCESVFLSANDQRMCSLEVVKFEGPAQISPTTESRNLKLKVKGHVAISRGRVRFSVEGRGGVAAEGVVTPDAPMDFDVEVAVQPDKRFFTLRAVPLDGEPAGLSGTFEHHAI